MTTTKNSTFGELLNEQEMEDVVSSIMATMKAIKRFRGNSQIAKTKELILDRTKRMLDCDEEHAELMANAYIAIFNRCDFVLCGQNVSFDLPDRQWLGVFLSGLEENSRGEGLFFYKKKDLPDYVGPRYAYRFGIE